MTCKVPDAIMVALAGIKKGDYVVYESPMIKELARVATVIGNEITLDNNALQFLGGSGTPIFSKVSGRQLGSTNGKIRMALGNEVKDFFLRDELNGLALEIERVRDIIGRVAKKEKHVEALRSAVDRLVEAVNQIAADG